MAKDNETSTELLNTDSGKIVFAPDVIATIAGLAATEIKGIAGMSAGVVEGITGMLGKKSLTKGVKAEVGSEEAAIDVSVVVEYGTPIHDVCAQAQKAIKNAIETMTGLKVVEVNVSVQGINFEKPAKPEKAENKKAEQIEPPRVK